MERYEGRRNSRTKSSRQFSKEQPKKYLKNFSRQLFAASLCLTVIFFAKDIDHPFVKQARETLKYALNYSIDIQWIQTSLTAFLQNLTDHTSDQEQAIPANAQSDTTSENHFSNTEEGSLNNDNENSTQENQS